MTVPLVRRLATPVVALTISVAGVGIGHTLTRSVAATSSPLDFATVELNRAPAGARSVRTVAPALSGVESWISAVGAAVAQGDFDGNGLADEACLVDPRDDSVTMIPVPSSRSGFVSTRLTTPPSPAPSAPMGCVPIDVDEDGDSDALVYYWGRSPVVFLNLGRGRLMPEELVMPAQIWNSTAVDVGDVDGDGHADILVANYYPDGARILDPGDVGGQRISLQDSMSRARNGGVNRLLLTQPRGRDQIPAVKDASDSLPGDSAGSWTLAFGLQDLNGDSRPELYVANDFGPDQLLLNTSTTPGRAAWREVRGPRDLTTPKSQVLGYDSFKGMGVTFLHPDADPLPSIFVSNITEPFALQESNFLFDPVGTGTDLDRGRNPYRSTAERRGLARSGWSWDAKAVDLNNDGRDEIYQTTGFVAGTTNRWPMLQELAMANDGLTQHPAGWLRVRPGDDLSGRDTDRIWQQDAHGTFEDVALASGVDYPLPSRGVSVGDVNGDGRPDLLVGDQWNDSRLLLNRSRAGVALSLDLRQPGRNGGTRPAIGAGVVVRPPGGEPRYRQVYPANGHAGVSAPDVLVGLGSVATTSTQTTVLTWRDSGGQHTETLALLPGRHRLTLLPTGEVVSA